MALTMTCNRTQTTLSKLAQLVANIRGELEFLDSLRKAVACEDTGLQQALERRRQNLVERLGALECTMHQFDPNLALAEIGPSDEWQKRFGRLRTVETLRRRYVAALQ